VHVLPPCDARLQERNAEAIAAVHVSSGLRLADAWVTSVHALPVAPAMRSSCVP